MQNIDRIWYDCWCSKLNISVFITESYSARPKNIRLNSTHHFIMKIWKKWEFQQISFHLSSDIGFKDFMNLYKNAQQTISFVSDWYYSCIR